jgi:3'-phosphoadenosine 5'-phosphosulfate sulfotransferase (PAPS reductase)/FAD synthetase
MAQLELLDVHEFSKKKRKRKHAEQSRHFVSFGAGVQSTALFLLIRDKPDKIREAMGALPEAFIFADTGGEPKEVYDHLNEIRSMAQESMPLIVCKKDGPTLEQVILNKEGSRFIPIPAFTRSSGEVGMLKRQCTSEYKIAPLEV